MAIFATATAPTPSPTYKLQGRAEVENARDPAYEAWIASQNYRRGAVALAANDYKLAASCFKQAGDGFAGSAGHERYLAEARFAQAQSCRLAKLDDEANKLYKVAVDLFRKYDPQNPYLKAGQGILDEIARASKLKGQASTTKLQGAASTTKLQGEAATTPAIYQPPMEGKLASVDSTVVLKGKAINLESKLKDTDFFNGAKRMMDPGVADVSENYVKDAVYKGFVKMTCLEFAALGHNYYTAPDSYHAFKAPNGKTVIVGATDNEDNPVIRLKLNDKQYGVSMYLPGLSKSSRNVLLVNDGTHVLALDPRKQDVWKLVPVFNKNGTADFSWWKLTHVKKNNSTVNCHPTAAASPF